MNAEVYVPPDFAQIEPFIAEGNRETVFSFFEQYREYCRLLREELEARTRELDRARDTHRSFEAKLKSISENVPEGILRLDRGCCLIYANPAAARMMHSSREELLGKTPSELPMPLHLASLWQGGVQRALESEREETVEYEFDSHHTVHSLRITMTPERGPDGEIESVLAITRDISEQTKAAVALREIEERFRLALEASPIIVYAQDGTLRYTWVYSSHSELKAELFLGRLDRDIYPSEEADRLVALKQRVMDSGRPERAEFETATPERELRLEINVSPLRNNEGHIIGITGVALDISERTRVEKDLRHQKTLLESINRIFGEALFAATEEELGRSILRVAERQTGSKFGFIGEIGPDGLLHDVAISDPGWDLCTMYDQAGHRMSPGNFPIRGLYGRVLRDGQSLIANTPPGHPDSTGLPEGHPPLTAFLGVPLIRGGKILGMVALGNREGGYGPLEREAVEILAPVMAEALEHKRAELALRESEERYRSLIKIARSIILRWNPDGTLTFVNDYGLEIFGYTRAELIGKNVMMLVPEREASGRDLSALSGEIARNPDQYRGFENENLRRNGEVITISWTNTPIWDRHGELAEILAIGVDVTERTRAEEALRKSEEKFHGVFSQSPAGIVILDRDGRIVEHNPAFQNMLGRPAEELTGMSLSDFAHPESSEDETGFAYEFPESKRVPCETETRFLRRNGETIWVRLTVTALYDSNGNAWVNLALVEDITRRKRGEEALRRNEAALEGILDAVQESIWMFSPGGITLLANRTALARWGKPADTVLGKQLSEFLAPELAASRLAHIHQVAESGQQVEFEDERAGMIFLHSAYPVLDSRGRVSSVAIFSRDITEKKRREARVARLTSLYSILSRVNEVIVRTHDENILFREACRIVSEEGEFPLVWIGKIDEGQIIPVARAGTAEDYLKEIRVETDGPLGMGPTGTCIRENHPVVNDDFDSNPATSPWRAAALHYGFRASAAFPLRRGGKVTGAITLYAQQPGVYDAEQIALLESLSNDISYSLDAIDQEELRMLAEYELREANKRLLKQSEELWNQSEKLQSAYEELQAQSEELQAQAEELQTANEELLAANEALRESENRARHRAEEVETLMEVAPVAIWVSRDPECRVITGNRMANEFYEAKEGENVSAGPWPGEPVAPRKFFRLGRELAPEELPMQEAARNNRDVRFSELEVRLPSGRKLFMLGSASPLRDARGTVRGGVGAFVDITERRQLEQRIAALRREQEAFLRHEVKNLFAPIQLFAELILDSDNLTDDQVHALQRIVETAKRAAGFIDSMKQIHDIETGKYALRLVRQSLNPVIRHVIQNLEPLAVKNGVTIRYREPKKAPRIPLDPQLLPGVFTNLIQNAIEHVAELSDPAEKAVLVEVRRARNRCIIQITNRGAPIPPERLETFFEKFNSGPEKRGGTGLGTTYAWSVIRAHGGGIAVTSDELKGTTVTMELPEYNNEKPGENS